MVNRLIINGTQSNPGDWPWHASLFRYEDRSFTYICSGAILDENVIVTVAHCLVTNTGIIARERMVVHVGQTQVIVKNQHAREYQPLELIIHPEYDHSSSENFDIALIRLDADISYNNYIQPVCLWNRNDDENTIVGSYGYVVAFKHGDSEKSNQPLYVIRLPVVSMMECMKSNREFFCKTLTPQMLCAGGLGFGGPCNGDSGAGCYFEYDNVWYIRGLASFAESTTPCNLQEYSVFTDVAKYLSWIELYLRRKNSEPVKLVTDASKLALLPMDTCGASNFVASREGPINPVVVGYPWMGVLMYNTSQNIIVPSHCQATLISDRYLVTAANCLVTPTTEQRISFVALGQLDPKTLMECLLMYGQKVCASPTQVLRIESVIVHSDFNKPLYANDIALIRLLDRADFSRNNVKPICLPVTKELRSQKPNHFTLTSWFVSYNGNTLENVPAEVIDSVECQSRFNQQTFAQEKNSRQICISHGNEIWRPCKRPYLGASLHLKQQVNGAARYVLYGVLSKGVAVCIAHYPDIYTDIASYVDWILNNMKN